MTRTPRPSETGHEYVDIRVPPEQRAPIRFTFFWTAAGHWEGRDFQVGVDVGGVEAPIRPDSRDIYTTTPLSPVRRRSYEHEPEEHRQ